MSLSTCRFAPSQVILGHDLDLTKVSECATAFPRRYAAEWPLVPWTNWCCLGRRTAHIQFHIRYLTTVKNPIINSGYQPSYSGVRFSRDWGQIIELGDCSTLDIVETRTSIAILTTLRDKKPSYTMVTLTDDSEFSLDCLEYRKEMHALGLRRCEGLAGVVFFQCAVGQTLREWSRRWHATLNKISNMCRIEVCELEFREKPQGRPDI
jgi:hypothetical protein